MHLIIFSHPCEKMKKLQKIITVTEKANLKKLYNIFSEIKILNSTLEA